MVVLLKDGEGIAKEPGAGVVNVDGVFSCGGIPVQLCKAGFRDYVCSSHILAKDLIKAGLHTRCGATGAGLASPCGVLQAERIYAGKRTRRNVVVGIAPCSETKGIRFDDLPIAES